MFDVRFEKILFYYEWQEAYRQSQYDTKNVKKFEEQRWGAAILK